MSRDRAARVDEDGRSGEPGLHEDDREGFVDRGLAHDRRGRVGRRLGGGVEVAHVPDPHRAGRRCDRAVPGQDEREVRSAHRAVAQGVLDEEGDVLARLLASEVDEQRALEPVAPAEGVGVGGRRRDRSRDPRRPPGGRRSRRACRRAPASGRALKMKPRQAWNDVPHDPELRERLVVQAGDQDRPLGDERDAPQRRAEQVRREADEVMLPAVRSEVREEIRARHRRFRPAPLLLRPEPPAPEDPLLEPGVAPLVTGTERETADDHAPDERDPRPDGVLPGQVVARTGREHLDRASGRCQVLGEPPDQRLGAAHDVVTVARHHEPYAQGSRGHSPHPAHGRRPITA